MSTYLIVHGGLMGGWAWREVAQLLRKGGHEVFTPTLTGCSAEFAKSQGWWYRTLPTGHGPNFTMPGELTQLLIELA